MRTSRSLDVLFPKTRQAILAATFAAPQRWWYMRELARHLRRTPSSLQRELASLVRGGILLQRHEGKHVYFKAAADSPIFPELQSLILKTAGLADVIRDALKPLADRIQWAFIYGSVARSEEHTASDHWPCWFGRGVDSTTQCRATAESRCGPNHIYRRRAHRQSEVKSSLRYYGRAFEETLHPGRSS